MTIKERYTLWRRYRMMMRELGDYRHHELSDLGIARADIHRLAYDAVYGSLAKTTGAAG
jgi:uncharacterized protein YjiS (DUF1127 family)